MNALYEYWKKNDQLIDKSLPDCIIEEAFDKISEIRRQIESQPFSQNHMTDLDCQMDNTFNHENWLEMCHDTNVFKLSHDKSYRTANLLGEKTFYGFLIDSLTSAGK